MRSLGPMLKRCMGRNRERVDVNVHVHVLSVAEYGETIGHRRFAGNKNSPLNAEPRSTEHCPDRSRTL